MLSKMNSSMRTILCTIFYYVSKRLLIGKLYITQNVNNYVCQYNIMYIILSDYRFHFENIFHIFLRETETTQYNNLVREKINFSS